MIMPPSNVVTDLHDGGLYVGLRFPMWTLYDHPRDFPNHYVLRLFDGGTARPTATVFLADTLQQIHEAMPPQFYRLPRFVDDDPKILEVYL